MKKTIYFLCLLALAFSVAGKVWAQENIVTVPDSVEPPIPTDMVIKQPSEVDSKNSGWPLQDDSQGASCFDYYKFQSVQVSLGAEKDSYRPGEKIVFKGSLTNQNDYPIVDGYVFARISQKNAKFMQEGNFIIDEIMPFANVALDTKEQQKKQFEWVVPQGVSSGDYRIDYFFSVGKKFNLGGLPFSNEVIIGTANFTIVDGSSAYVSFNRSATKLNDQAYQHIGNWPVVEAGKSATITQPLANTFNATKQATITYDLFYWDSLNEKDKISTKQETVSLAANETKTLTYTVDNINRSVYYLRMTAVADGQKSIVNVRFVSEKESPRLNYSAITKFPIKKGETASLFACFHNTSSLAPEGKVVVTLTDQNGKEVAKAEYSGNIASAMAVTKKDFTAANDYGYLKLSAKILDKDGKQIDVYENVYDCSQLAFDQCKQDGMVNAGKEKTAEGISFNKIFMVVLILTLVLIVVIVVIFKRRGINNGNPKLFIWIAALFIGMGVFSHTALAYNEQSVAPSAPFEVSYVYADFNTGSWAWDCYGILPIIRGGNMTITHTVGMTQGDYTVNINNPINFAYGEPTMFFIGSGGSFGTPYGDWRSDLNSYDYGKWSDTYYTLKGESSQQRNPSLTNAQEAYAEYHNKFEAMFTGVKPTGTYMTSSNPSVISCSGMNCTSLASGTATLTANIPATQTRVWSRFQIGNINNFDWVYAHEPRCWPTLGVCYSHSACVVPGSCSCSASGTNVLPVPAAAVSWDVTVTSPIPPADPIISVSCPSPGTAGNVSWTAPTGTTYYAFRLNDETRSGWDGSCGPANGAGDICENIPAPTTSRNFVGNPGSNYTAWIHACNAHGCSPAGNGRIFTCTPLSYVCTGTIPANATMFAGDNIGLAVDTLYTYWATDTGTRCQYSCNIGYSWNGSSCVPAATGDINAVSTSIAFGAATNIYWTSTNATSCTVTPPNWTGTSKANPPGQTTGPLNGSATYTLNCSGPGGNSVPDSVTVNVSCPSICPSESAWNNIDCSVSCGGGVKTGTCTRTDCTTYTQTRVCNEQPCLNEGYKEVAPW